VTGPVDGPIDARVEWFYDSQWNDVSDDVDMRSEITVAYGQPDEHGQAEPTEINLLMRNELGQSAPEEPTGERYGKIGRGTRMRVRIGDPQPTGTLVLPGLDGSYASTPDTGVLDITGDIDVRVDVDPGGQWLVPGIGANLLASKFDRNSDEVSWVLYTVIDGVIRFLWSPNGTFASFVTARSTVGVPIQSGRVAVRVTLDVNNGAGGHTVNFYTASTISGPWTQLGSTVTAAGTTSIYSGTAPVELGSVEGGVGVFADTDALSGTIYGFELRNGIAGTAVANPDFTALDEGTTSFTDAAGRTWSLHGAAQLAVRDPSIRGSVAAVSWTPTWDESGLDARMAVRGAGILERLGHGREPLRSPLTYDLSTAATTVAYWPCEDGASATTVAAAVGDQTLAVTGEVTMASYSEFAGSGPVSTFDTGGHMTGLVPSYTPNVRQRVACMLHQTSSMGADVNLISTTCAGGSISEAILVLKADGSLRLVLRDIVGANVLDSAGSVADLRDENAMIWMLFTQNGANINWQVGKIEEGESAVFFFDGTLNSHSYGRFTSINIGSDGDLAGTAVGHVHVVNGDDTEGLWTTVASSLIAWDGERAGNRLGRLCRQESVPYLLDGSTLDTERLGPQGIDQLLTSLDAAAAADAGPWGERRDAYSLLYRTRADLYNQEPALTLDMDDGTITTAFSPPLDTQSVRNDVTVTRTGGSSYRAIQQTGPLSVQDPPDGIGGSYPSSPQLNLYSDLQVANQATWRLHLGTAPGHRIPSLEIEMHHHPELVQAVLELRNGDLVRILNTPVGLPPGPLDLIVLGATDSITEQTWHVTLNVAPGAPWTVAVVSDGTDENRLHTDGSTTVEDFDAGTDTTLTVDTTTPYAPWTTDPAQFPLDIVASGVVLEVTAITAESTNAINPNTTFEAGNTGWEGDGGTLTNSTAQAHGGTHSALLTPNGVSTINRVRVPVGDAITVYPGIAYTFSVWVYSANGRSVDTFIQWLDDTSTPLTGDTPITTVAVPTATWTQIVCTDRAVAGATQARPHVNQRSTPAAGDLLYVDDAVLTGHRQTFTITQTPANGIEKTIPAGSAVQVYHPMDIPL
jgi:hypothetical protein